jgi:hypothetical protein
MRYAPCIIPESELFSKSIKEQTLMLGFNNLLDFNNATRKIDAVNYSTISDYYLRYRFLPPTNQSRVVPGGPLGKL